MMDGIAVILFGILLVFMVICVLLTSIVNALVDIHSVLKKWKDGE